MSPAKKTSTAKRKVAGKKTTARRKPAAKKATCLCEPIQRHESQDHKHRASRDDPVLQPPRFATVRTRSTVRWLG